MQVDVLKKKNGRKQLIFDDSVNKNKKLLKKYIEFWDGTKIKIKEKMETYCVMCGKKTEKLKPKVLKTKNGRLIMQSKCNKRGIKKSRFVKEQEAKKILSNL